MIIHNSFIDICYMDKKKLDNLFQGSVKKGQDKFSHMFLHRGPTLASDYFC